MFPQPPDLDARFMDSEISIDSKSIKPQRMLFALVYLQIALWTLIPFLMNSAPPLDAIELFSTNGQFVIATYKHPNLPGLLFDISHALTGSASLSFYLIPQVCVVFSFILVYLLGRDIFCEQRAVTGVLLLTGIFYYSWPTPVLNHNVVQMPLWALVALALWRATESGRLGWWLLLGIAGSLSLWAKYSAGVFLLVCLIWLLIDTRGRSHFLTPGPWFSFLILVVVAAPQFYFLYTHDFLPLQYAAQRAANGRIGGWLGFFGAQFADHLMMFVLAAGAGLIGRGALHSSVLTPENRVKLFLTVLGLGPLIFICLLSLLFDSGLKDMWGFPMFNLSGLLFIAWFPGRFNAAVLPKLFKAAMGLLVVLPLAFGLETLLHPYMFDKPKRTNWPQAQITEFFSKAYSDSTGSVLKLVVGPYWHTGLVALSAEPRPNILIEGDPVKSPWFTDKFLSESGALIVWPGSDMPSGALSDFLKENGLNVAAAREQIFTWSQRGTARTISFKYLIVPPDKSFERPIP